MPARSPRWSGWVDRSRPGEAVASLRLFVGIELPDAIKEQLGIIGTQQAMRLNTARWIAPANLHITLKFLGATDDGVVPEIVERIAKASEGIGGFTFRLAGFGGFPSTRSARIFWMGARGASEELAATARAVDRATAELGFPSESRPFHAHVTLARLKVPQDASALAESLGEGGPFGDGGSPSVPVDWLAIYKSTLKLSGAEYEVRHRIPLQGDELAL